MTSIKKSDPITNELIDSLNLKEYPIKVPIKGTYISGVKVETVGEWNKVAPSKWKFKTID